MTNQPSRKVLVVDEDRDIAETVRAILTDEGFTVSVLSSAHMTAVQAAVGQLEPDCIILDGLTPRSPGESWDIAAWVAQRERPIPVIMLSADAVATREAQGRTSQRSIAAHFAAIVLKPFQLEPLLAAVTEATGAVLPFDDSVQGNAQRTSRLFLRLAEAGARDIHQSTRREWVTFRVQSGALVQLYWWQLGGVYLVGWYPPDGPHMIPLGQFYDVQAAIEVAMTAG